jgi:hypothetical protein
MRRTGATTLLMVDQLMLDQRGLNGPRASPGD